MVKEESMILICTQSLRPRFHMSPSPANAIQQRAVPAAVLLVVLTALSSNAVADLNHCRTKEGKVIVTDGDCPQGSQKTRIVTPPAAATQPETNINKTGASEPKTVTSKELVRPAQSAKPMQY
jgi:hypothetical protein